MQCLVCHEQRPKHLMRERTNKSRVFCGNLCQETFYATSVGLKHDDIDDPDMIGLESSDGILFKIRLQDAMEWNTSSRMRQQEGHRMSNCPSQALRAHHRCARQR